MKKNKKNSGWKIFFYLTPVYVILAYPLYNWHKKINSENINLRQDEYSIFSSKEGETKKPSSFSLYEPKFQDVGYSVNYKSGGETLEDSYGKTGSAGSDKGKERGLTKKNMDPNIRLNTAGGESIGGIKGKYTGKTKGFSNSSLSISNNDSRKDNAALSLKNIAHNAIPLKSPTSKKRKLSATEREDVNGGNTKIDSSSKQKRSNSDDAKIEELTQKMKDYIEDCEEIIKACKLTPRVQTMHLGRGGLFCWVTPAGKRVFQYDDGMFGDGAWLKQTKRAFPGAARLFADKFNDDKILGQKVTGYRSRVMSYIGGGRYGTYVYGGAAPIPDAVHWDIYISGGYKIEFDHSNTRDCIYSGNGVYYLSGNGHSVAIPAQTGSYNGMPTCIRCHVGER
ncbi:MAG: hypothetical protein U9Q34_06290 [Elusimicrobiota bacterium]|nr:hypothetical protein [Elusimicrobiota bacterium]